MSSTATQNSLLLAKSVVKLSPAGLRTKRFAALTTMILPLIGTAIAVYLLITRQCIWTDVVSFAVMYCIHMGGVTIGLHRYITHRSFETFRWFADVLIAAGSTAAQGPLLFWVATHRRHHRFSDQEGDPHSPNLHGRDWKARLRGLWYAHMPWMLSDESSKWSVYAPDLLQDRRLIWQHNLYPAWVIAGLLLPAAAAFAVDHTLRSAFGGFVFGGLARIFVANQASWCVGSICHAYGSRPFPNDDHSTNNWLVAVLTFGEGLQNNHHAFPCSFRHAIQWWEPDLSGWIISVFGRVGLVWGIREPDRLTIAQRRIGD